MEQLTRVRDGMLILALALGVTACAGDGYQEPYEEPPEEMERPPAMENPATRPGSLETQ